MSRNHDNVTWKSADGKWYLGFFREIGFDEDEFDHSMFEWVSHGFARQEDAEMAYRDGGYPNPGGGNIVDGRNAETVKNLDLLAKFYFDPAFKKQYESSKFATQKAEKVAALVAKCEHANWFQGQHVSVSVAENDEAMATGFGSFVSKEGVLSFSGDWLLLNNDMKVWNKSTREFNGLVYSIRLANPSFRNRW